MICPKCGAHAKRNGAGRGLCREGHSFFVAAAEAAQLAETATRARQGDAPAFDMTHPVPPGFMVKGVSTAYREDGTISQQWVKSALDPAQWDAILAAMREGFTAELPQVESTPSAGTHLRHLMAAYPIGDAHIGMRAWREECGEDWDLAIAERVQCAAMAALVEGAPPAAEALIVNLGDWFHYDSMEPVTSRSGHVLDSDGRYAKMIRVGIKVMRQCIASALAKHKRVRVVNVVGNHDDTGALWLSAALAHMYEHEPRVEIDTSPAPFTYVRHGRCLVGLHHGHSCKGDKLPGVMAADRPQDWGETEHRYWWLGHVHHQSVKEYPGVSVETFGTLAAKDAYATAGGWRARRQMHCVVLHAEFGEVARHTVNPAMLAAA